MVGLSVFTGIVDTARTTLVELVAEMKAGSAPGVTLPSHEVAEQAVDLAINGNRNRIVITQAAPHATTAPAAGGVASTGGTELKTSPRRVMWRIVGVATVIGAVPVVALLVA